MIQISTVANDTMDIVTLPELPSDRTFHIQAHEHTIEVYTGDYFFSGHLIEAGHRAVFNQANRKWFEFWKPKTYWKLTKYQKLG